MKTISKLWILLAILAVAAPIGLVLPAHFKAGPGWGEWGLEDVKTLAGYIPKGLERLSSLWCAPIPAYTLKGWGGRPMSSLSLAYIMSAIVGVIVTAAAIFAIGKFLMKKD